MIAILGSGFGLYGYLPALVGGGGHRVILPERSRAEFEARVELARFGSQTEWAADDAAALDRANGIVLALPPAAQVEWIPRCLARPDLRYLLLEKPLAPSPGTAAALWTTLAHSSKAIRIGYTFRFTAWAEHLQESLSESGHAPLSIEWNFLAHHFRYNLVTWKRSHATGGGAIRFYGIQLIALLAEIGYRDVLISHSFGRSEDEVDGWSATFAGVNLPECTVALATRAATPGFKVERPGLIFANQSDPFADPAETGQDVRVPALTKLCRTLWEPAGDESSWYGAVIEFWRRVELATQFHRAEFPSKP